MMLKNLKERDIDTKSWPDFMQKEGYIVSTVDKVFTVLSDITRNKGQKSLDDFRPLKSSENLPYKNTKISPNYEEEEPDAYSNYRPKSKEDRVFDEIEANRNMNYKLDEVNEENIDRWTEILNDALKDISLITKKESTRISLEDLYQAFKTMSRIKERMVNSQRKDSIKEDRKSGDDPTFSRPSLSDIKKNAIEQRFEKYMAKRNIQDDFYICISQDNGMRGQKPVKNFGLWCFNPGFCFNEISELGLRSIILTSGTLSPMKSFAFELQTQFEVELENTHVIDKKQVCMGVMSKGPSGKEFQFTYQSRNDDKMLIDLGESILKVAERSPDGMLVFFPSYALMDK